MAPNGAKDGGKGQQRETPEAEIWTPGCGVLLPTYMKPDAHKGRWGEGFVTASARGSLSARFHFIPKITTPNAPMLKLITA